MKLKKFVFICETASKVKSESIWMENNPFISNNEKEEIKKGLCHTKTSQNIITFQRKGIDPLNYCEIVGERYLDNFTIDIAVGKFIDDAERQGNHNTSYFPSELVFFWLMSSDKSFKSRKITERLIMLPDQANTTQVPVPVHFEHASH